MIYVEKESGGFRHMKFRDQNVMKFIPAKSRDAVTKILVARFGTGFSAVREGEGLAIYRNPGAAPGDASKKYLVATFPGDAYIAEIDGADLIVYGLSGGDGVIAATVSTEPSSDKTSTGDAARDHLIRVGAIRNADQRAGLRRMNQRNREHAAGVR
jgi:hypothetical protein